MMADSATAALKRESLLPWRATGRLPRSDIRQIDAMIAKDASLARIYADIRDERSGIVAMNEDMGVPSPRTLAALFAAIDLDIAAGEITC